ncbi:hypothetical protein [Porphyrobacter sp. AAP82]|uniref:hypothetical protein n=1 Tax=Porphyrobacter sp. AAP82 TaxID=1248917 RepID=UPI0012DF7AD7|nr:hypothetical protein [Porphyrobacter sp. AAP82]
MPAVSVSHDPAPGEAPGEGSVPPAASHAPADQASSGDPRARHEGALWPGQLEWLELLRDGLTFDLSGLAPGPASAFPVFLHRFDLPVLPSSDDFEAMVLRPGPHLAEGAGSLPLMRELLALGCDIVRQFEDVLAVGWGPAATAIGQRYFESVTSAWLDGGPFPALGLTAFAETPDAALESVGLAFWIGQELRIEPPLSADRVAATRLGIRLVNHLVLAGGLAGDDRIIAPDGSRLVLRPSRSRALISVWRE